jgi:hypothetical protein
MSSTLDTVCEALQVALLPELTAIEKDLAALRSEIERDNQTLRSDMERDNQSLRSDMERNNHALRADMDLKFSILLSETQKIGIRTELMSDKIKAETETCVHRSLAPLGERVAVLEMSLRTLKEKFEKAS